ncbi:MAG: cbb3-type cytochrome c oxidase subunit I, partial [Advenella sp.]
EGLMWRSTEADGTLTYAFIQALASKYVLYIIRIVGGMCFLSGVLVMFYNMIMTIKGLKGVNPQVPELVGHDARIAQPATAV